MRHLHVLIATSDDVTTDLLTELAADDLPRPRIIQARCWAISRRRIAARPRTIELAMSEPNSSRKPSRRARSWSGGLPSDAADNSGAVGR